MLFSNTKVSSFINDHFEPVWETVRAVPTVTIDFGGGKVVKRTLHGNIATYVCTADGYVVDLLPGIYEPNTYVARLADLADLADRQSKISADPAQTKQALSAYHQNAVASAAYGAGSAVYSEPALLARADAATEQVAGLSKDTVLNETARRRLIHAKLASSGLVKPDDIKHWLYKVVLHADLDDPYLGLGPTLFAAYPFHD